MDRKGRAALGGDSEYLVFVWKAAQISTENPPRMRPRTFRFLPGGPTPSKTAEVRLRFIDSAATTVEDWIVTGADGLDLAGSGSGYVFVGILA